MASFMDKLKKGMNVKTVSSVEEEVPVEEVETEELEESEEEESSTSSEETPEEDDGSETEESAEESEEESAVGPEEISVEEMEERINANKPAGMAEHVSAKNLISKMISEDEPTHRKSKKKKTAVSHTKKAHHVAPKEETDHKIKTVEAKRKEWFQSDGELVVDVYELDGYLIIKSAIAGVNPEDLDISIENDTVSIKGSRKEITTERDRNYFHQECYWGGFSREIILPVEVDGGKTEASMKNGILTIKVPKIEHEKRKISIR